MSDSVGEKIKLLLISKGMRPAQLAQVTGLSTSTVDDIIKGKTNELTVGVGKMLKIASVLGVTIEELYDHGISVDSLERLLLNRFRTLNKEEGEQVTINERIRYLRKEVLKLNQTDFATSIGLKQRGASYLEQNGSTVTDRVIKSICMVYDVNESWLRTGDGDKFVQASTFSLDQFVQEHGVSQFELEILKAYFELDADIRRTILDHFKAKFSAPTSSDNEPSTV